MASSEIEIVNQALYRAGATKLLSGDLETVVGPEGGVARLLYPQYRDELLESFRWPFATKRVVLAELAEVTRTDWTYVYAVPSDLRKALRIVEAGNRSPRPDDLIPFHLEAGDDVDADAGIILTDQEAAELLYVANVTNPVRFTALFTAALAWRLAIDFALGVTAKPELAQTAERQYQWALQQAMVHAANQGVADPEPAPDFLEGYADDRLLRRLKLSSDG